MRWGTSLALATLLLVFTNVGYSQQGRSKWGFGLDLGGQRLYGEGNINSGIGFGIEGFASYRVLRFADVAFLLGYSELKYDLPSGVPNTTNLINADLKGNFELVSRGTIRPFVTLGLGVINFEVGRSGKGRFFDGTVFGGGGLKVQLSPQFDLMLGADYRFITSDTIDDPTLSGTSGSANDGYLNIRTGFAYHLPGEGYDSPQIIADEDVPYYEVDEQGYPYPEQENYPASPEKETKNMEEYIRLKSRIDELSEGIDEKENKVASLRGSLSERKQRVASLKQKAAGKRSVSRQQSSSLSGFSEIYEEALTSYYNKNYNEAVSLFRVLIEKYPNHSLASNYQYWLGQSLLALNRYQESVAAFYKVLNYEGSFKKDDSLFLLGQAYLKMGSGESAKESFSRLVREYPNSEYVSEAQGYLNRL